MKLKERKGNESEKQVKPVKKSVALVLTIVTVFAFAAACFSLGFCSGKKVNEAYAAAADSRYYYVNKTVDLPSSASGSSFSFSSRGRNFNYIRFSATNGLQYMTNGSSSSAKETVVVYTSANGWVSELYRYIYVSDITGQDTPSYLLSNAVETAVPVLYAGTYTWYDSLELWGTPSNYYDMSVEFTSNGQKFTAFGANSTQLRYRYPGNKLYTYVYSFTTEEWSNAAYKEITLGHDTAIVPDFFYSIFRNFASFSASSEPEPVLYTCTLSENTSGMYSFGYIEGDGVTYDENAETIKGPADSYFQVQLMPFEGYMVDTFTVTDSDGTAKSIVKNSDTLYTITFDAEDFVLNISATVKEIEYTLTCEYEGAQNYSITYGMTGEITRNGNVFTGQPGASAYVRITPNDGYIMRSLSYQITDGSVASVTPGSSNNYTIVLTSSNATILFSVVATAATVDISSGYYWIQCRNYGTDFSELTLQPGQFQIVDSVSSSGIVWQDLTGLVCGAGKISFRLPGDKRISVYTVTETHDDFSLSSGVVISDQGNIIEGYDYDYYSTLWAANWYPVIYVPSNIMEDEVSDILVSFFKSSSVYKADPVYYSGFYLTKKDTIANSNAFYNTYLGIYVPVANTLVSPSSVSFIPDSGGVSNITYKSALNFMGDVSSGEYVIYCGYDYNYNSTVSYNRVGRIPPAPRPGTYMESIYIYPTIMPERLYNLMARWFDIASGPVAPDPPPSSYWDGLEEVLGYEIFGVPLSSLLAIVISSVFVVVVIRLFAGG